MMAGNHSPYSVCNYLWSRPIFVCRRITCPPCRGNFGTPSRFQQRDNAILTLACMRNSDFRYVFDRHDSFGYRSGNRMIYGITTVLLNDLQNCIQQRFWGVLLSRHCTLSPHIQHSDEVFLCGETYLDSRILDESLYYLRYCPDIQSIISST